MVGFAHARPQVAAGEGEALFPCAGSEKNLFGPDQPVSAVLGYAKDPVAENANHGSIEPGFHRGQLLQALRQEAANLDPPGAGVAACY